ncbi:MAG: acyl-CoA thioesterase [Pseudomonadota bacterium]
MNLYLRLFFRLLLACRAPACTTESSTSARFRVLPSDIDLFGHMNNGRYAQIFDVARAEWMLRCGVLGAMRRHRWGAVIGGSTIRFRRALTLGQRYEVRTRLLGWDDRWFYLEHRACTLAGDTVAVGLCRTALLSGPRWVATADVVAAVDPERSQPALPRAVTDWLRTEAALCSGAATANACTSPDPGRADARQPVRQVQAA